MYFFIHFLFGALTNITNSFSTYMIQKKIIPYKTFHDENDTKIIGTWKISGDKLYKEAGNNLLSTLYKIPYECKCTQNMIFYYAYTLGQFCTTFYFWSRIHNSTFYHLAYTPSKLYDEW